LEKHAVYPFDANWSHPVGLNIG